MADTIFIKLYKFYICPRPVFRELSLESDVFLDSFEEISGKIQSFSQYDLGFVHLTLFNAPLCPIAVQLSSRVHTVRITCSLNIPCKRLLAAHACRFKTYPRLLVFTIKFDILVTLAACLWSTTTLPMAKLTHRLVFFQLLKGYARGYMGARQWL